MSRLKKIRNDRSAQRPAPEAVEFTVRFWANLLSSPQTDFDFVKPDGSTLTTNMPGAVRAQFPPTTEQITVFTTHLLASIEDPRGRWFGTGRGGVEPTRDLGLNGHPGFVISSVGRLCPPLQQAVAAAGLTIWHLGLGVTSRTMPAYVSVTLKQDEPEALAWRHPSMDLPQCPATRPAPGGRTVHWGERLGFDRRSARDQCGHTKFHTGDHGDWTTAERPGRNMR
ncbi:hypothetical protein ABH935_007070 [Catenulispora sp. GAS73]|uniref:hypothetical protein n=1 Tax=Catenulispora sp. GAS73 TaxID=3156269 RepID=UPI003511AB01